MCEQKFFLIQKCSGKEKVNISLNGNEIIIIDNQS